MLWCGCACVTVAMGHLREALQKGKLRWKLDPRRARTFLGGKGQGRRRTAEQASRVRNDAWRPRPRISDGERSLPSGPVRAARAAPALARPVRAAKVRSLERRVRTLCRCTPRV